MVIVSIHKSELGSSFDSNGDDQRWSRLMRAAQAGDEQSYRLLLAELADVIAAYLYSRFGALESAEDCVQECLLAIHEARRSYDGKRAFRPWLFTIVKHKTIDLLRRQQSYRLAKEKAANFVGAVNAVSPGSIAEEVVAGQLLQSLSPQHREALVLTKVNGLSIQEAALAMGISNGAMKVRVHRAVSATRKLLDRDRI